MSREKTLNKLAHCVGTFIEYWGFKSIHGRLWVFLYLSKEPLSSRDLKEQLGISKALLSMSLNELKEYKVIIEAGTGKHGVELFNANPNVMEAILQVLKSREKAIISNVFYEIKELEEIGKVRLDELNISEERLKSLMKLARFAQSAVENFLKFDNLILSKLKVFKKT